MSPGESFSNSLGVDASVKLEYRNIGKVQASQGIFTKTDVSTQKYLTTIKNTKNVPVTLVIADQVS